MKPSLAFAALTLVCISGSTARADEPAPTGDLAKLQGTWRGKGGPNGPSDVVIEFKDSKITMTFAAPNGKKRTGVATAKLDESARPKALDLVDFRNIEDQKPDPAPPFIYSVEGDKLKLCGASGVGTARPTQFKTVGEGRPTAILLELTRDKPAAK